ncbi:MAG: HD domain-containing protein [Acidimicrobiia bacterium]|nr:HD domain-containing protein [Acidimicrobiia bacterium]
MVSAKTLAEELLAKDLPRRWQHVQAVGRRAGLFANALQQRELTNLIAAGFVHDIGYAEPIMDTGFHPIDGARHLRRLGFDEDIVCLVAHHTCAHIEADLRELGTTLQTEFPRHVALPHDELLFCDLTTGPCGELVTVEDRLAEVKTRYGADHLVHRFITTAEDQLLAAAERAKAKLASKAWAA